MSPIMRGTQYLALATEKLLFLDMINYVAAGTSYAKWLAGFQVEECKGIFCYEYITSFARLSETQLPPIEAFYSTLKQKGITNEEYENLQQTWTDKGFRTMKDYLIWYNSLDVGPFLKALEKMCSIFQDMGIDMLKGGSISLPGVAMVKMFKDLPPDTMFQLFNEKNKDIREKIKRNIVGGPSQPFKRMAQKGVGAIKRDGPPPQGVQGRDCNALYPYTFKREFPDGIGRRFDPVEGVGEPVPTNGEEDDKFECYELIKANKAKMFKGTLTGEGRAEYVAVNHMFRRVLTEFPDKNLTLQHRYNGGQKMFRFGKQRIPVDGWVPQKRIILQYHGCRWHGHNCRKNQNQEPLLMAQKAQDTEEIAAKLRTKGRLIQLRECDFEAEQRQDPQVKAYVKSFQLPKFWREEASASKILEEIGTGEFFGLVEVDLQVPFWKKDLREKMAEFPPIFKNAEISIDDIGETLGQFARENGLMKKPRRALISSYHAEKMLFATPYVKWLMEHGVVVTRLHFAVQYLPKKMLAHLPDEVAHHRREADKNPDRKAYGELFKLLSNSYFGKCLTDVSKHRQVHYLHRPDAARKIQSPLYRKVEIVNDDVYEVQMAKGTVEYKLPILVAFFVYSYAKQRMNEFYYDFLLRVMPFNSFELLEMDTDSLYFATAKPTLEDCIPLAAPPSYSIKSNTISWC